MLCLLDRLRGRFNLVKHGVDRVGASQATGWAVECRGKEHRLTILGDAGDDAIYLWLKAHVQHPVRLIEDEDLNPFERHQSPFDEVLKPAGGRNNDLRAARTASLVVKAGAAVDRRHAQPARFCDP